MGQFFSRKWQGRRLNGRKVAIFEMGELPMLPHIAHHPPGRRSADQESRADMATNARVQFPLAFRGIIARLVGLLKVQLSVLSAYWSSPRPNLGKGSTPPNIYQCQAQREVQLDGPILWLHERVSGAMRKIY